MDRFDNTVKNWLSVIDNNEYLSGGLAIILILYASLAAPQLPESIARLFDHPLVQLLVFFLIGYGAKKDPTVAIIAAIAVMITLQTLNRFKFNRQIMGAMTAAEVENVPTKEGMEEVVMEVIPETRSNLEEQIPEDVLTEINMETTSENGVEPEQLQGCFKRGNFRNSFYPQYTNMKPDAYMARYTGNNVSGYDSTAAYASI